MGRLSGLRIVVTRAAHQAGKLLADLEREGAEAIAIPMVSIEPPADGEPLRQAAREIGRYDWIVFTSANAVRPLADLLGVRAGNCEAKVAAVGTATRSAAEEAGFDVALAPTNFDAESLAEALAAHGLDGARILFPAAAVTRDVLPMELRKHGAEVTVVEAYRNTAPREAAARAEKLFREPLPDWILFASPSAVDHLADLVELEALRKVRMGSIGPITSEGIRAKGLDVAAEAREHTAEGLLSAILAYYA